MKYVKLLNHDMEHKMKKVTNEQIIEILKTCFDPELPIDLWNLGLIYKIDIESKNNGKSDIDITMSLTTPGCSMGDYMANDIKNKISESIKEAGNINVTVTFEPQWDPSMMTDHAREKLGFPIMNSTSNNIEDNSNWE